VRANPPFRQPRHPVGLGSDDESKTIAALRAEIEALKTAATRTTTPAITSPPSPVAASDDHPSPVVAYPPQVYRPRAAAQVHHARMIMDNAGANLPAYWPGHPSRDTDVDAGPQRMLAGHTHEGVDRSVDRSMMLLLNVQQQQIAQQHLQQQQQMQQQHYLDNFHFLYGGFQPPRHN
jgi:hypothetical protein